jgi:hypothetical protein
MRPNLPCGKFRSRDREWLGDVLGHPRGWGRHRNVRAEYFVDARGREVLRTSQKVEWSSDDVCETPADALRAHGEAVRCSADGRWCP